MCVGTLAYASSGGSQRSMVDSFFINLDFVLWGAGSFTEPGIALAGQQAPRDQLVSCHCHAGLLYGFKELTLGPHGCTLFL